MICQTAEQTVHLSDTLSGNQSVGIQNNKGFGLVSHLASMNLGLDFSNDFLVGHPQIDKEHKELFRYAKDLLMLFLQNTPRDQIAVRIRSMYKLLEDHFNHEEEILSQMNYPRLKHQHEQHQAILVKALRMISYYEAHSMSFGDMYTFLYGEIVKGHFMAEDMKMKGIFTDL